MSREPMDKPRYTQARCPICRVSRAFKFVNKRDVQGRELMVCTQCSTHIPRPGAKKNPDY